MEGSVDEGSTESDEEYDDLAMQDIQENGYWCDDEEFKYKEVVPTSGESHDHFARTKGKLLSELPCSYSFLAREKNEKRVQCFGNVKLRKHSQSIPAFEKHGSVTKDAILSGTPQR